MQVLRDAILAARTENELFGKFAECVQVRFGNRSLAAASGVFAAFLCFIAVAVVVSVVSASLAWSSVLSPGPVHNVKPQSWQCESVAKQNKNRR